MKWRGRRRSDNVEDRRGQSSRGGLPGGLRIPTRLPGGRAGAGGGLGFIALIVIATLLKLDEFACDHKKTLVPTKVGT